MATTPMDHMDTKNTDRRSGNRTLLILVAVAVVIIVAVAIAVMLPDNRTSSERMADAIEALPQGVDAAAEELEDKSPVEKMTDRSARSPD